MNKQAYMKPTMSVVEIKAAGFLCASGERVNAIGGGTVQYGGAGDGGTTGGSPRSRGFDGWEEEEEDDF